MALEESFSKDFYSTRFDSIQTLRGICAWLIVMQHMRFFARGAFGVDIFFCISGFMIMLTTRCGPEEASKDRTGFFLRKRLIRIVPFYYLMTILTFALLMAYPEMFEQTQTSFQFLIKSLLFIPFDIGEGVLQPLLRVGWTINCEVFFYVLFFLALHISQRYRGLICTALLAVCVLVGAAGSGGRTVTGESLLGLQPFFSQNTLLTTDSVSPWLAPVFFYGCPVMLEFALGILCYYIAGVVFERMKNVQHKRVGFFALFAGAAMLVILIFTAPHVNLLGWRRLLVWGVPAMLTVLAFFTAGLFLVMPRCSVRLGDISFSIYLIHYYLVMYMDREVFDFSTLTLTSALGALLTIALVTIAAAFTWYFIEVRFTAFLRGKLCRKTRQISSKCTQAL
ncbi:MAG: acyltransferase [Clostridiales bacterium]|nr:acyltransferase [Clostridiales bacterium]